MPIDHPKAIVSQLGAREYYAIPRMLHKRGALLRLHTDYWNPVPSSLKPILTKFGGSIAQRAFGRSSFDLPGQLVRAHTLPAMFWNYRLRRAKNRRDTYRIHARWGRHFAERVARDLDRAEFTSFLGFSSAALESLLTAKKKGALAVLDEIAPTHLEEAILAEERRAFPGWEPHGDPVCPAFLDRLEREWNAADRIIVNSPWTKQALAARAVQENKIHVVPLTYDLPALPSRKRGPRDGDLRILWLGTLCLRKGLPYAIEAARLLIGFPVRFTFAGPAAVDLKAACLPPNATYIGAVPRSQTARIWAAHDIFLLPTLSDGFGITQLEAIAHGLPVIATACCGEVVENGRSGYLVPPRDARAIADAIVSVLDGASDIEFDSHCALQRAQHFTANAVWPKLEKALFCDALAEHTPLVPHHEKWRSACAS